METMQEAWSLLYFQPLRGKWAGDMLKETLLVHKNTQHGAVPSAKVPKHQHKNQDVPVAKLKRICIVYEDRARIVTKKGTWAIVRCQEVSLK